MNEIRVGHGIDIHQFGEGRKCILGGIEVPTDRGLLGHSDADVIVHALMDALLGASGERDIGTLFPDTDPALEGIDSCILLAKVWTRISEAGWRLCNADITLLAQVPKVAPYVEQMRAKLSSILGVSMAQITIKATTTEKLGFIGREEGVAASAVVLLGRGGVEI